MSDQEWRKLNIGFDAEPNSPEARITVDGSSVELRFFLNPFIHDDVEDDEEARLVFDNVRKFRYAADENDEGIVKGKSRFGDRGIGGDFFELLHSDWSSEFPEDCVDLSTEAQGGLRHFIYFLKEGTFECVAVTYRFERLGSLGN